MQAVTSLLIFVIPVLGLIAGLSLSVTIPLFMFFSLYIIKDNIDLTFKKFKLELVFFLFLALSCFWSINIVASFLAFFKSFSVVFVTYILITNSQILSEKIQLPSRLLILPIFGALLLFYIELLSDGFISLWFRKFFQGKESQQFYLHYLDRGCTLLALFAWVVIAALIKENKNIAAIALYIIVVVTLALSDSLAAYVGYLVAGIVFLLTKYTFLRNPKILSVILLLCGAGFIYMAILLQPKQISDEVKFLPNSAKHRLFIWDYVTNKAMEKPILGWGYASSHDFDVKESEIINYNGHIMHPLPMHPHNNILQIFLENGIVGLVLYMLLACKYLLQWSHIFERQHSDKSSSIKASGYAAFSNFFIISMISFNMWQSWWLSSFLWIAILLCIISNFTKIKHINLI